MNDYSLEFTVAYSALTTLALFWMIHINQALVKLIQELVELAKDDKP
jgi:cytoplasmic iron level regulating protein YaaA (DUF328/UPF0246 family)